MLWAEIVDNHTVARVCLVPKRSSDTSRGWTSSFDGVLDELASIWALHLIGLPGVLSDLDGMRVLCRRVRRA